MICMSTRWIMGVSLILIASNIIFQRLSEWSGETPDYAEAGERSFFQLLAIIVLLLGNISHGQKRR